MYSTGTSHGIRTESIPGVSSSLGERLQRYRNRLNISGEELASHINDEYGARTISRSIIANIENGRRKVTKFDEIVQLAHGLQITPLALIVDLEQPFLPADNPVFLGLSNYEVANRFLVHSSILSISRPGPLAKLLQIYSIYKEYTWNIHRILKAFDLFKSAVDDGQKVKMEDFLPDKFIVLDQKNDCLFLLQELKTIYERFEMIGVVIPASEQSHYDHAVSVFNEYVKKAESKKLLTIEIEREYDKWLTGYDKDKSDSFRRKKDHF